MRAVPLPAERPPSRNNVETRGIIIEDGAVLRGKVEVHQKDQPPQPPRPAVPAHAKEAVATAFRKGSMCKILSYAISSRSSFLTTRDPTIRTMGHHLGNYNAALSGLIAKYDTNAGYQIAQVYAYRGESDKSFEWLERAYEQRDAGLPDIKTDPLFKNLRHDRRYTDLLKKMRLPT
jgi:hypothetical protein